MGQCGDMLVNLTHLPDEPKPEGIRIKRVMAKDREAVLEFIRQRWAGWCGEAEYAMLQDVSRCFIATENGKILGFACYDASAKDYFGPIGVDEAARGKKIGQALLLRCLHAMREFGYGYAVIGWVGDAAPFYEKTVGAFFIPGGEPENTVYSNLLAL